MFIPVVVRQDATARFSLRPVLPGGAWLEGLGIDVLVALWERLRP